MKKIILAVLFVFLFSSLVLAADVKLDWDAVDGATGYKIAMSNDLGTTWLAPVDAKPFFWWPKP